MSKRGARVDPLRVLILGGGFGGVYTAMRIHKRMARVGPVQLTVVNRDNFFLFTPMLHEVAASDLDLTHIVSPLRKLVPGATLFIGDVERIDLEQRFVTVSHAGGAHPHDLEYDHLVLALGSVTNFLGLPGVEDHSLSIKSLSDAIALRNRMIEVLEEADFECAIDQRHSLLGFVVAGGGFAGVETIAAMNDFLREAIRFYAHLDESQLHMVLVHAGEELLPELGSKLGAYARRKLGERGIDIRLRTRVREATPEAVRLSDDTTIPAQTVVWAAGTAPHPTVRALPCVTEGGRVLVDEQLRVPDWPGVWALGDCALVPDPATGGYQPPTAQHALREGAIVADNIIASERGEPLRSFSFKTIGQLAAIGRRTGVARVLGHNFSGFLAWWLWRTVYLAKLPRLERKVRVALDWTLDLLFTKDLVQVKAFQTTHPAAATDEPGRGPSASPTAADEPAALAAPR